MEDLPVELKTALLLRDVAGFSYAEIMEVAEASLPTVKWRIFRARVPVEDMPVLPTVRARLAAERARLWLRHVARHRRVDSRQRRHASAARDQPLPEVAKLSHSKAVSGQHSALSF